MPKLIEHPSLGTTAGEVLTFGTGDTGQLGLGGVMERKKPAVVSMDEGIVQICAGGMHTVALSKTGHVYSWGCNDEGSLGRLADDGTSALSDEDECALPGKVAFPEGTSKIVQISAGDSHSAALTEQGQVFFWGGWRDNSGIMTDKYISPVPIALPVAVQKISSGCHHILFLTTAGQVYSMGCGENGQLGRLSERFATRNARNWQAELMTPALVPLKYALKKGLSSGDLPPVPGLPVASNVWAGGYTSMVQLETGHVLGFGLNSASQLGFTTGGSNEAACVFQPRFLPDISQLKVREISCGHHHTLILGGDGVGCVYACGLKEYGALGLGGTEGVVSKPTKVDIDGENFKTVAAGTHLSFAVTDQGNMYSWGSATNNALGHGDEEDKEEPEVVTSKQLETRQVLAVSAGGQHSAILAIANNNNKVA